jgi:hypothetical protein
MSPKSYDTFSVTSVDSLISEKERAAAAQKPEKKPSLLKKAVKGKLHGMTHPISIFLRRST